MELRAPGPGGFDTNAFLHFRALAAESDPLSARILVCPQDHLKESATNFSTVKRENLSYRLRTSPDVTADSTQAVLFVCPVHGSSIFCDGTFIEPKKKPVSPDSFDYFQHGQLK